MKEQRKSRKSGSNRGALRILFTIAPLAIALLLITVPDFGKFSIVPLISVFAFGALAGTFINIYWIRTLLEERRFYKKFYDESVMKPQKNDLEMYKKHTRIILPFAIFAVLLLIIVLFVFGIAGLEGFYALPFLLGAMDGVPLGYYLMERGIVS